MLDLSKTRLKRHRQRLYQRQRHSLGGAVMIWLCLAWTWGLTWAGASELSAAPGPAQGSFKLAPLISSDSPYLLGRFGAWSEVDLQSLLKVWREMEAERAQFWSAALSSLEGEQAAQLSLIKERLSLPETREAWRAIGVDQIPELAIYGEGLIPTLAFTVDRKTPFLRWVQAQLEGLEHGFTERSHSSGDYWRRAFKRWTVILRVRPLPGGGPEEAVVQVSVLPRSSEPLVLSTLLAPPSKPLTEQTLRERLLVFSEGVIPSGWIDLQGLISAIFGTPSPALQISAQAFSFPLPPKMTGSCGEELIAISATAPLLSIGSSPSGERLETLFHLSAEARALLKGLSLPQHPFPQSQRGPDGSLPALDLKLALNPQGLLPLVTRLSQWGQRPWRCPMIKSLNRLSLSPEQLAQLPIYRGLWSGLRGLSIRLSELPSEGEGQLKGWLALRTLQAELLWGLIQGMGERAPRWLQGVQLKSDAAPVELSGAPKSWSKAALSSSSGGMLLSLDQGTLNSKVHQKHHEFFKAQGDPVKPPLVALTEEPALLSVSYRADTAHRAQALFRQFKERAQAVAQRGYKNLQGKPKDSNTTQSKSRTNISEPDSYMFRALSFTYHPRGLLLKVQELPSDPLIQKN